jgi:hypothetical protein
MPCGCRSGNKVQEEAAQAQAQIERSIEAQRVKTREEWAKAQAIANAEAKKRQVA